MTSWINTDVVISVMLWLLFVVACTAILSFEFIQQGRYRALAPLLAVIVSVSVGAAVYAYHYQNRIFHNHIRALALITVLLVLLGATKVGVLAGAGARWGPAWGRGRRSWRPLSW